MTRRRKAANPALAKPLTKAEDMFNRTGKVLTSTKPKPNYVLCSVCGRGGGVLIHDGKDGYKHLDPSVCKRV